MKIMSRLEAEAILGRTLAIGDWNEIKETSPNKSIPVACRPTTAAWELYAFSRELISWLDEDRILFQVDNSTAPTEEQIELFEGIADLASKHWDVASQHTFLLDLGSSFAGSERWRVELIAFFAIAFQWHVHLVGVGDKRDSTRRTALQDGSVYFFGDEQDLLSAKDLLADT